MENCTGIILAGGRSQRMGTDKGLLLLDGKSFVSHIYKALQPLFGENCIIVSSNPDYDFLGCTRVEDIIPNKGPLGGIYTGLKYSKTKMNIVVSVDAPLVTTELLQWMFSKHSELFLVSQLLVDGKTNPLVVVYDRSIRIQISEAIAGNKLKVRDLVDGVIHQDVQVPEKWKNQLVNINTPEEYQNLKR